MKDKILFAFIVFVLCLGGVALATPTRFQDVTVKGNLVVTGSTTATVTGHASSDLPLTGGTMTGAIKAKVPGNAFSIISTTGIKNSGDSTVSGQTTSGSATGAVTSKSTTFLNESGIVMYNQNGTRFRVYINASSVVAAPR